MTKHNRSKITSILLPLGIQLTFSVFLRHFPKPQTETPQNKDETRF